MGYGKWALVAGLALGSTVPAWAQPVTATAGADAAHAAQHKAACDALAAIVLPDSQVEPQSNRMVDTMLDQLFGMEGPLQRLESAYPGMRDALGAGMKPVMFKTVEQLMPAMRADLSALYQSNLTTADANEAAAFFTSPPVARMLGSLRQEIDFKATLGDVTSERPVTAADVRADLGAASAKAVKGMTPDETAFMGRFMASPLGLKLRLINPQKLEIEAKWMNYTNPEIEKTIETAVANAMVGHIALTDPEAADELRKEFAKPGS